MSAIQQALLMRGGVVLPAEWDPATKGINLTLSNSNLTAARTGGANSTGNAAVLTAKSITGKVYLECQLTVWNPNGITGTNNSPQWGVVDETAVSTITSAGTAVSWGSSFSVLVSNQRIAFYSRDGSAQCGAATFTGTSIGVGGILSIACDVPNKKVWFGVNGVWQNGGNPATNTGGLSFLGTIGSVVVGYIAWNTTNANDTTLLKPTSAAFSYSVPTGFIPYANS